MPSGQRQENGGGRAAERIGFGLVSFVPMWDPRWLVRRVGNFFAELNALGGFELVSV